MVFLPLSWKPIEYNYQRIILSSLTFYVSVLSADFKDGFDGLNLGVVD